MPPEQSGGIQKGEMKMDGQQREYRIVSIDGKKTTEKTKVGELYKEVFGIQLTRTLTRSVCFQITHIPTGHLLTNLIFSSVADAQRYIDWFTKDVEDIFESSDVNFISASLKGTKKLLKQKALEEKFGDKAVKFGN